MKQIDFETNNYDHKEELRDLTVTLNDLIEKYIEDSSNRAEPLRQVETSIEEKKVSLKNLEDTSFELSKRKDELRALKTATSDDIKELEMKKSAIDYTDSEVQKMETDDIDALIGSKKAKIDKIETKIETTRQELDSNAEAIRTCKQEVDELNISREHEKDTLYRTEAILDLLTSTRDMFNNNIENILKNTQAVMPEIDIHSAEVNDFTSHEEVKDNFSEPSLNENESYEEPQDYFKVEDAGVSEEINAEFTNNKEEELTFNQVDEIPEEPVDNEPTKIEITETPEANSSINDELETISNTSEVSILDFDVVGPEDAENSEEAKTEEKNEEQTSLSELFANEGLDFNSFDDVTQEKLKENADKVLKNMLVLKKHSIPLSYTMNQSEIYYNIEPQDLDDLLNIITTDDDGNGMGFAIEYTFNILSELSKTNVDRLIDVYNTEFMNVNAKSGLIELLKKANPEIGDFEVNRNANIVALNNLGVLTTSDIVSEYPEFINMDNPLFMNSLGIFDRDDLVNKLNEDIKIVPKIVDYWKNN